MQKTNSDGPCERSPAQRQIALPFVCRRNEVLQLQRLHAQRKHVLILGAAGVGKTALMNHLNAMVNPLTCPQSERFGSILDSLEAGLDLTAGDLKLPQRKRRLLCALTEVQQTVVFDGVTWITPKLSSFLEDAMERVQIWICTRSEHPWDIGHFWPLLVRFEKIELHPFRPAETRKLVVAAIEAGQIPGDVINIVEWLHHRSNGSPFILSELFEELAIRSYDLSNASALRRLDLDRRIHELLPATRTAE